jgi:hypothetical protein
MKKIFTFFLFSFLTVSVFCQSASTTVTISQAYPGGGLTTGTPTYIADYVELKNISSVPQDISGFSIQYGSATGVYASSPANLYVFPANTIIQPGRYLLIQVGPVGTVGAQFPVTPDQTTANLAMSQASGKLALSNQGASLACGSTAVPCGTTDFTKIVDAVAWGAATNAEGRPANDSVAMNNTQGVVRKVFGCQDTQNNNADFDVVTNPIPRNSSTAALLCSNFIAPLNLTAFNASLTDRKVQLVWTSLNEQNVDGFEVERSNDGRNFASVGKVKASNRSEAAYTFADHAPLAGLSYYRLKMIDNDGSVKYSSVVTIDNRKTVSANVFPNPTTGNLGVTHPKATTGARISIMSAEGRQVKTFVVASGTVQTNLNVSDLSQGNYVLIFDNDGSKSITKFVKN